MLPASAGMILSGLRPKGSIVGAPYLQRIILVQKSVNHADLQDNEPFCIRDESGEVSMGMSLNCKECVFTLKAQCGDDGHSYSQIGHPSLLLSCQCQ